MLITVDNPVDRVYERWKAAVEPEAGKGNVSMSNSKTLVKSKKYARIFLLGNPTVRGDLEGNESATTLSFQVDSFASGQKGLSTAYHIDSVSHETMVNMGFRRTYGPNETENTDSSIKRVTSRYSRLYAGKLLGEK